MTANEAQARAVALMGAGATATDRGANCHGGSRYLVGPHDWFNTTDAIIGAGATWEGAFADLAFKPIATALSRYSFVAHDERTLYPSLEQCLTEAGLTYVRERVLTPKSRVDFYFPDTCIAMEVKVQGTPATVLRQLARYAEVAEVAALLLVTTVGKLSRVPDTIAGKPVRSLRLAGGFG